MKNIETEEESRLYQVLTGHNDWIPILKEALRIEEKGKGEANESGYKYFGWEWYEIPADARTLNTMVVSRVIGIGYKSRNATHYMLKNPEAANRVISILEEPVEQLPSEEKEVPSDLFTSIVDHNNEKTILRYAIESQKPVHILLRGVPASGKTLFLIELSRLPNTCYALGPTLSEAGLADLLFISQPSFLLVDEIDRLGGQNLGVLNSLMATGIVSESKYRKTRTIMLNTKVFAAGIRIEKLPADLLSRFVKLNFPAYTREQFMKVTVNLLSREDISPDNASYIGEQVWSMNGTSADIRQCVYIARLAEANGTTTSRIKEIVKILKENNALNLTNR